MNTSDARLFKLSSMLFDAALGKKHYDTYSAAASSIGLDALAQAWGNSALAKRDLGENSETQARALVTRIGLDPDNEDKTSADILAYNFFKNNLDSGANAGTLALASIRYLEKDNLASGFNNATSFLNNRAEAAYQYSTQMELSGADLAALQSVIKAVDEKEESIQTALLTVAQDEFQSIRETSKLNTYTSDDDSISGTDASDYIDAGAGYDSIYGNGGNDIIQAGSGQDYVVGGYGQDSIDGGDGSDQIYAGSYYEETYHRSHYDDNGNWVSSYYSYEVDAHYEILNGESGHDSIYGGYGSDYITGGTGNDKLYGDHYVFSSSQYNTIDSATQTRMYDDTIDGGEGADTVEGGAGNDSLLGNTGNDYIEGNNGNDTIEGGSGNDKIFGGYGADYIKGGTGNDVIYSSSSSWDADDETAVDSIYGGDGNDSIQASNSDNVDGGAGDDWIDFVRTEYDGHGVVIAGEGKDVVDIDNDHPWNSQIKTAVTIDLTEETPVRDTVYFDVANREKNAIEIKGFDLSNDLIELGMDFDIHDPTDSYNISRSSAQWFDNGNVSRNYVQIVSNTETEWVEYTYSSDSVNTPDSYGKSIFVIQNATIDTAGTTDAAALIDLYGDNSSYGEDEVHLFLVNVKDVGIGLYVFTDDSGGNDRVVSDELQLLGTINDVFTEDVTMNNAYFLT